MTITQDRIINELCMITARIGTREYYKQINDVSIEILKMIKPDLSRVEFHALDLVNDYSSDVRFGMCLGVDKELLLKMESEVDSLENIVYCSEDSVHKGECPACEYRKEFNAFGKVLLLNEMCSIHKQVFTGEPNPSKLKQLAMKQLT